MINSDGIDAAYRAMLMRSQEMKTHV